MAWMLCALCKQRVNVRLEDADFSVAVRCVRVDLNGHCRQNEQTIFVSKNSVSGKTSCDQVRSSPSLNTSLNVSSFMLLMRFQLSVFVFPLAVFLQFQIAAFTAHVAG